MLPEIKRLYEFGEFRLDLEERVLLRDGEPVPITPKVFQLLKFLIENRGRVIEQDELMTEIWQDSYVEKSNLAFNVRQLRKALDDDARQPTFIETVPKRGYRFIAEVREIVSEAASNNGTATPAVSHAVEKISARPAKLKKFLLPAAALFIVGVITVFWYAQSKTGEINAPILFAPFASEKLSTNGKVVHAVLSSDGKTVVYTNSSGGGKQSVWLRQLESDNNVEIIPPSDDFYYGLELSPDGSDLYFVRQPKGSESQFGIYRVSIFGGVPQKIISETQGWISLSADGARISFVRCSYRDDEFCSLWIADASDGKNEKKLVSNPRPIRIRDHEISPDGKTVVYAVGQSENQANEFGLAEVDIESGERRELTGEKFFDIKNLARLPGESGLLITASRIPNKNFRVWQVSLASGEVKPLTKDSESYATLSFDKAASRLVATQFKEDFQMRLFELENASANRVLADGTYAHFAPNGKIFFTSIMSGNDEIWSINPDGGEQRQLTNDAADDSRPVISPDGNSIFYASNRAGAAHVWRMNADGSNQTPITKKEGGFPIFASPDGKWLYYHHGINRTLWRVSIESGEEQTVSDKARHIFAFSPDGSQIAFSERHGEERFLTIVSPADWQTIKTFKPAVERQRLLEIAWLPDGKSLAYTLADNNYENNTLWLQPLDRETPQKIADLGDDEVGSLRFSPDGKNFIIMQGGWRHDAVLLKGLK